MDQDPESIVLLNRWKAGDEAAAEEIFYRYVRRLSRLAQSRLSERMQARVDADDVLQSVFRSFFHHAKDNRYELQRSGDLWSLLAAITIKKTLKRVKFHQAAKRAIDAEQRAPVDRTLHGIDPMQLAHEPTSDEALAMAEEIEVFMQRLTPKERQVLEMRLQDRSTTSIADAIGSSPVTVRRILRSLKQRLSERLLESKS